MTEPVAKALGRATAEPISAFLLKSAAPRPPVSNDVDDLPPYGDALGLVPPEGAARHEALRGLPHGVAGEGVAPASWPDLQSKEMLRILLYGVLMALDLGAIVFGFMAADLFRHAGDVTDAVALVATVAPVFLLASFHARAYSLDILRRPSLGARRAGRALFIALAAGLTIAFVTKTSGEFSRLVFLVGAGVSLATLIVGRLLVGTALGKGFDWRFSNDLVIADGVHVPSGGREIVLSAARLELNKTTIEPLILDRLGRLLMNCDRVIIACRPERQEDWARMLKGVDVDIEILTPSLARLGALETRKFGDRPTLLVGCGALSPTDRAFKRLLDLAIAGPVLMALAPVMLLIAALIKIDSKGPVFFRQLRVGRGNRLFAVLKFRTMKTDATDMLGRRSCARDDDRVTRIGRFLRKSSLDELPQLLNVLSGDMSVVGPRPHAVASTAADEYFWEIDERYFHRHTIKPGITGLAQVRGYRGATERRTDLLNRLQSDLEYVSGWSIGRDILIILKTFRVLIHRNAF